MSNLIKKAQLIKKFSWSGWNTSKLIRELYVNSKIRLISDKSGKFNDYWITYEDCIYGSVSIDGDQVEIEVCCFDGDLLNGQPVSLRWIAYFSGSLGLLKSFKEFIDYEWPNYLERQFQKEEMDRKLNRIREIESRLLASESS